MNIQEILTEELLVEGGAAIKGASPVTQALARKLIPHLRKKIADHYGIDVEKVQAIGSAGNKPNDTDTSGDIDIAIELDQEAVAEKLEGLAERTRAMKGINVYSFAEPVGETVVQVDMMPVKNIEFAAWSYQAHPEDLKAGLKGSHRNELFFAVARHADYRVLDKDGEGNVTDVERHFYDLGRGLMRGKQTRRGAKKLKKGFKTVEKNVIADTPKSVTKALFGDGVSAKDVSTFAGTLKAIKSPSFPWKDALEDILTMAKNGIAGKKLKEVEL